ncbi:MAG: NADH-quinone oxidoreductase subunit L, partial [Parvibaculales bacterium]
MLYKTILFLPLCGAIAAGLFGRVLGARGAEIITTAFVMLAAILSFIGFSQMGAESLHIPILEWVHVGSFVADWQLRIDRLTLVMLVVVNMVSALVHLYSIGYMHEDRSRPRFFAYLSLFTFAMLALVTADNLVQLFFGWEGVGLASYLLIGFWFEKSSANAAAIKAFVVNRVGDFGFILGICLLYMAVGSVHFDDIFAAAPTLAKSTISLGGFELSTLTLACLLLFMGAMGKSAQFLLHTWLPDAMEGPTPVSALIHAATMVTAGVFLVARCSPLYEFAPNALIVVTAIGAITAFFAASVGLVQNDIKRVIAYSTCSQLGYMFVALGVGAYQAAMFHLFTHAFFKALLFLGAGGVIHALHHEQDLRKMGGLKNLLPASWIIMLIGTLALTGFPLTAGYFSKDMIIEAAYAGKNIIHLHAFWLLVIAAFFTSFYSWRLMFMTFHGTPRVSNEILSQAHEPPFSMMVPLLLLAGGALLSGWLFHSAFIGHHQAEFWAGAIFTNPENHILEAAHHVPKWVKLMPVLMMSGGFLLAWFFYILAPSLPHKLAGAQQIAYRFLLHKWYFDEIYDFLFVMPAHW